MSVYFFLFLVLVCIVDFILVYTEGTSRAKSKGWQEGFDAAKKLYRKK